MLTEPTEQATDILDDLNAVQEDARGEEWETLIRAKRSGKTVLVSQSVACYFRDVLPPAWMPSGGAAFAFCEGDDQYTVFVEYRGQWLMRTIPYGERAPAVLDERAREMVGAYARHLSAVELQAKDAQAVVTQA